MPVDEDAAHSPRHVGSARAARRGLRLDRPPDHGWSTAWSMRAGSFCAASTTWPERRGECAVGPSRRAHAARTPFRRCSDGRREAVAHVCRRNVSARPRCGSRPPRASGCDAEQGARGHRLLLGDQGALHDRGRDRRGLPLRQPRARARPHDGHDVRRADRGPDLAVLAPPVRARRLLARGRPHQHRRHADHGQPHGRLRRQPAAQHGRVRDRARRSLRGLVRERAHALDPHDRDAAGARASTGLPCCSPSRSARPRAIWSRSGSPSATGSRRCCSGRGSPSSMPCTGRSG